MLLGDVVDLVDSLDEPVALVGHSLGGHLALRTALARPEKVWALVVEDPAKPTGDTPDPVFVAATEAFLDSMPPDRLPARVEEMLAETPWSRAETRRGPPVSRLSTATTSTAGSARRPGLGGTVQQPDRAELLLVPPTSDMAPRQELLHNDLLRTVVIPDSGHCVRRDQPERYYRAVDAFLDETLRRRRDAVDRP